jgi:hypothetical protein
LHTKFNQINRERRLKKHFESIKIVCYYYVIA